MQSLAWYYHRLKRMSPAEVLWRVRGAARDSADLVRLPLGLYPKLDPPAPFSEMTWGFDPCPPVAELPEDMRQRTFALADRVLANRLSFFEHDDLDLGDPINWHRDWNQGIDSAVRPCPLVDYRVAEVAGDCKQVWEPSRHHQLVALARAYFISGEVKYAEGVWRLLDSWIEANPFGHGMNWKSPLELGVRVINWVWALALTKSYAPDDALWRKVHRAMHQHVWDLARKFSQGSSANNHLIGEAAGVFIATAFLPHLPDAATLRAEAQAVLAGEIDQQLFESGCTREQALGYQFFSLQFFTLCARAAELIGEPFDASFESRLEAGYRFLAEVAEGGAELPLFGDKDDGYVLNLGDHSHDVRAIVDLYHGHYNDGQGCRSESSYWLFGHIPQTDLPAPPATPLQSRSYPEAGHYFMQCGEAERRISLQIDCAPLGYGLLTAHGHADALACTLRLGGLLMLVDPGTYDYFTYPDWRNAFRRTINHNTVSIDAQDQSEIRGPFLFGTIAESHCLEWRDDDTSSVLLGRHDGYERLDDPVSVLRRYELNKSARTVEITDELRCAGQHEAAIAWHFHPECEVTINGHHVTARRADQTLEMWLPEGTDVERYHGDETTKLGWFSDRYHRKSAATTVLARAVLSGDQSFTTRVACS